MARHRHHLIGAALLLTLAACAPREELSGAVVIWASEDGMDRVVQLGPCVKTQAYDDYSYAWRTTHTECVVPSTQP